MGHSIQAFNVSFSVKKKKERKSIILLKKKRKEKSVRAFCLINPNPRVIFKTYIFFSRKTYST